MTADSVQVVDVRLAARVQFALRAVGAARVVTAVVVIGIDERADVETFVHRELDRQLQLRPAPARFLHGRKLRHIEIPTRTDRCSSVRGFAAERRKARRYRSIAARRWLRIHKTAIGQFCCLPWSDFQQRCLGIFLAAWH